jgi:predicted nucleic acid-binding protein
MKLMHISGGCAMTNKDLFARLDNSARVYVDTNAFIYLLEASPAFFAGVKEFFDHAARSGAQLLTNELTLAECIYRPSREENSVLVSRYEDLLEPGDEVEIIRLDGALAKRAAMAGGKLGLKLTDAIHYVSAYESGCQFFATADSRVRSSPGIEVLNLRPQ